MLSTTLRLPERLRIALLGSGVTGEIKAHGSGDNLKAIDRLLASDPYVTFGIQSVHQAVEQHRFDRDQVIEIMAGALGSTPQRFCEPGPGYIDPRLTAVRLREMLDFLEARSKRGNIFLLATAHPGSLLSYYSKLEAFISRHNGHIFRAQAPAVVGEYRWVDQVGGVHVLSDMGGLLHTHDAAMFGNFLKDLPELPDVVVSDHGFAGAAINQGITTVAIHDVDDPGLPLAARLGIDVRLVPMNDNQLNLPTATALEAVMHARSAI